MTVRSAMWRGGVASALILICGIATYLATKSNARHEHSEDQPSETAAEQASATSATTIAALHDDVAELRTQVRAMTILLASRDNAPDAAVALEEGPQLGEQRRAEEKRRRREYMIGVETTFRHESIDPKWSANTTSLLRAALSTDEALSGAVPNVECRSRTCRVTIADDGTGDLYRALPIFALEVGTTLSHAVTEQIDEANGSKSLVLYLSHAES